jgi:hypothetical protein
MYWLSERTRKLLLNLPRLPIYLVVILAGRKSTTCLQFKKQIRIVKSIIQASGKLGRKIEIESIYTTLKICITNSLKSLRKISRNTIIKIYPLNILDQVICILNLINESDSLGEAVKNVKKFRKMVKLYTLLITITTSSSCYC